MKFRLCSYSEVTHWQEGSTEGETSLCSTIYPRNTVKGRVENIKKTETARRIKKEKERGESSPVSSVVVKDTYYFL